MVVKEMVVEKVKEVKEMAVESGVKWMVVERELPELVVEKVKEMAVELVVKRVVVKGTNVLLCKICGHYKRRRTSNSDTHKKLKTILEMKEY
ncbi:hypothetical protein SOVF_002520 [Spinacia oleracea]|nr:hypothetical protein SOVF_002520 [Spinacia oleracea]